ncbi:hypothetical protein TBLA_0D05090 [Henningerozyma blattae CBS 6284]|uniref:alpha,alpha-trehalase n=1 Tax=Henningerozyma blattae (strain ATCC 34711 / CBS 6284 / DSM 70876 / NBRC 10599 / NRRL Y-10934 / UCD 77-7) TaxID=1071380 RepID=I2H3Q1_HENB6|nr:hypothetical protein TBLA_0D05090 [Tetrapisispora blattae CBS 6284]CCH61003.1 hypothetical protein TBLA_0D05090 [Tetrapisispora blattae CBS 6284]
MIFNILFSIFFNIFIILQYLQVVSGLKSQNKTNNLYQILIDNNDNSYYDSTNQILGTKQFTKQHAYSRQPYVANGYIGSRIPNVGFGYALDTINLWAANSSVEGALNNGWPLRNHRYAGSFVSDFFSQQEKLTSTNFPELDEVGYSTVIASIPEWTNIKIILSVNGTDHLISPEALIDENNMSNYFQNMSMSNGVVTTSFNYLNDLVNIKTEVFAHREISYLGILSLNVTLLNPNEYMMDQIDIQVVDILDFNSSHRTVLNEYGYDLKNGAIFMSVSPENTDDSVASLYSTLQIENDIEYNTAYSKINEKIEHSLSCKIDLNNPTIIFNKFVGIISTEYGNDADFNSTFKMAKSSILDLSLNYTQLYDSNYVAWKKLLENTDLSIPGDSLLDMTAKSSIFHLLSNTRSKNVADNRGLPVSVSGLSSDSYGGMVFWDSDLWIQPSLLPFFPKISNKMINYRNATHEQAKINANSYGYDGALYPWTSGKFANCTSTGPCFDYEYHINIDIALAAISLYMSGGGDEDYLRYTAWPIVNDAAKFFSEYVQYNETSGMYVTQNMTDPDEFADFIDNGAFTNAGIRSLLKWATDIGHHLNETIDENWMEISKNLYIPKADTNITLEYTGMNSTTKVKQADVALMVYPLGFITDESNLNDAVKDLFYYSEHQSAAGPAMTFPVFVAAASSLLNHGTSSESYLYKSVIPFLRGPFAQFSEQADDDFMKNGETQPAFPFLTAHGGFLQSILFGLTGIRYSYEMNTQTNKIERFLRFDPIKLELLNGGLHIQGFHFLGQTLDISTDDDFGYIKHKNGTQNIRIKVPTRNYFSDEVDIFTRNNKTSNFEKRTIGNEFFGREEEKSKSYSNGTFITLEPGEEVKIPLFKPLKNIPSNLAEGKQVANLTEGVPGDVPFSLVDGNNYTHWQPANKSSISRVIIDLGAYNSSNISGGQILWGSRPAKYFSISVIPSVFNFTTKVQMNKIIEEESISVIDNQVVLPSKPFYAEIVEDSIIDLLPSNVTNFEFNFKNINEKYPNHSNISNLIRYVLFSFEGTYDNDTEVTGATVKEISIISSD